MKLKDINIRERMKHYNVMGLSMALINDGKVSMTKEYGILEAGTDNLVDTQSIFNACSMSKFLTSILVLKLSEQGILELDEDVNKKLKSWKYHDNELTLNKKVTLRTLLSHQSGIIDPAGSFTELQNPHDIPTMVDILEGRTSYCAKAIDINYEPSSDFRYSDAGFCVIQQLIEDALERPFEKIMGEFIFEVLEMKNSTFVTTVKKENSNRFACGHNKNGGLTKDKYPIYPYPAAAGLWTTPTDLSILIIELLNSLKGKGKLGLSESKVKEMISAQGCKEWAGLGVFLDGSGQEIEISSLGWGEGFQCMLVAYPYLESGAVIMTNTNLGIHQLKGIIGEIYNSLEQ